MHDTADVITAKGHQQSTASDETLARKIYNAAHVLPTQAPISNFVHHNTLHAWEEQAFDTAVVEGSRLYGAQPYLSEATYHRYLQTGRITHADLQAVLRDDLADGDVKLIGNCSRYQVRLAMLSNLLPIGTDAELHWLIAESDALTSFRDDVPVATRQQSLERFRIAALEVLATEVGQPNSRQSQLLIGKLFSCFNTDRILEWSPGTWENVYLQGLWWACRKGVHHVPAPLQAHVSSLRPRTWLWEQTALDVDQAVNELLIRFTAAFVDQGLAAWPLPHREQGFYQAFLELFADGQWSVDGRYRALARELKRLQESGVTPLAAIRQTLTAFDVADEDEEAFFAETLLALRGWAGMVQQLEQRAGSLENPIPQQSLIEFVAVRLILDRVFATYLAKQQLGHRGPLGMLRSRSQHGRQQRPSQDQRAFILFQLAQLLGWTPDQLLELSVAQWKALVEDIEAFTPLERRRLLQQAFERYYHHRALAAIASHVKRRDTSKPSLRPRFQVACCIDDREESFRRHLEEVEPACETFGTAGFFGVAMYYRGAADAYFRPLCPAVVQPQHWVSEEVLPDSWDQFQRRTRLRRALGNASLRVHVGSRTFTWGVVTAALGPLASIPLVARVVMPHFTARLRRKFSSYVSPPVDTQLKLHRDDTTAPGGETALGYQLDEMAAIVEGMLREIGLVSNFSRMIYILGHGSSSLNNPHESAYNCGACAGGRGGPNARAIAKMANNVQVRKILAQRGLVIPDDTHFVGGYHNTCDDGITYYDCEWIPASHMEDSKHARSCLDQARSLNAKERCRRFASAAAGISPNEALRHVETRAEDLAQSRPEYNHATNAICVVGRRSLTRGLYMDRRAFLTCYNPECDDDQLTILARILRAVIPVCAGISLEYYFSTVDPAVWGCGSKLPHNVTSLVGVMEGASGDLRPGLSAQMVEIHEAMRVLFVIETTPQALMDFLAAHPAMDRLVRNQWVYLATLDGTSGEIQIYRQGVFEPFSTEELTLPVVERSEQWFVGRREHLDFAVVRAAMK